jgi:protein TonB
MKRISFEVTAGFVLSGLLHATLLVLITDRDMDSGRIADRMVPLELAMFHFREQTRATPGPVEKVAQADSEPAPQPKPALERKVAPKRKAAPERNTEPVAKPEFRLKSRQRSTSRPAAETASTPITIPPQTRKQVASVARDSRVPPDSGLIASLENQYKSRLRALIEDNKRYPRSARKMHYQGKAKVSFVVRRDGHIEQIRLTESTGYDLLDEAALDAIKSASGQLPFPEDIQRSQWAFTIPINYRLQ